jgi:hypothetical protein
MIPEKIETQIPIKNMSIKIVAIKDVPFICLAGEKAAEAVRRYNLHKRLVDVIDRYIQYRKGEDIIIDDIVDDMKQLLKEAKE